jgi:type VI secretion system protein ImpF
MFKKNIKERPVQSLLERLLVFKDPAFDADNPLMTLIRSLEKDLQNLLNTRKIYDNLPEQLAELSISLVGYGVPDLTTISIDSEMQKQKFCQAVQLAIENYEPRLRDIKVELLDTDKQIELIFRLRISAILLIEPEPVPVSFDSALLSNTRLFDVTGHALDQD